MKKATYSIPVAYRYNPEKKGAPYTLDGARWLNAGELIEIQVKGALGYEPRKDGNGRFDECSDIPELNASVKSSKATLTTARLGETFEEILTSYFEKTVSTTWIYGALIDDTLVTYTMNRDEFEEFMRKFSRLEANQNIIRIKWTSSKMLAWLDERAA